LTSRTTPAGYFLSGQHYLYRTNDDSGKRSFSVYILITQALGSVMWAENCVINSLKLRVMSTFHHLQQLPAGGRGDQVVNLSHFLQPNNDESGANFLFPGTFRDYLGHAQPRGRGDGISVAEGSILSFRGNAQTLSTNPNSAMFL
jgi:hypothetical protein